ncbi:hypothetical protein JW766_01305 [Candidatus Dojkabacteria bacterium]|nr:hypothetical protein [Candidatus Dojkabacteria bacterium]
MEEAEQAFDQESMGGDRIDAARYVLEHSLDILGRWLIQREDLENGFGELELNLEHCLVQREEIRGQLDVLRNLLTRLLEDSGSFKRVVSKAEQHSLEVPGVTGYPAGKATHTYTRFAARQTDTMFIPPGRRENQLMFEGREEIVTGSTKLAAFTDVVGGRVEQLTGTMEKIGTAKGAEEASDYNQRVRLPLLERLFNLPLESIVIANTPVEYNQQLRTIIFHKQIGIRATRYYDRVEVSLIIFPGNQEAPVSTLTLRVDEYEPEVLESIYGAFRYIGDVMERLKEPRRQVRGR